MVRMMPKEEIGVWALFVSVTTILELLRNGFIRNPLITHLVSARTEDERGKIIMASLMLHCILVFFVSLFLLFSAVPLTRFWNAPQLDVLFYIYVLRGLVLIPGLHFEYLQQAQVNFKAIFLANLTRMAPLAIYIIVVYFIGSGITLVEITVVQLLSTVVSLAVGYYFVRGQTLVYQIDRNMIRTLFSFGKFTLGTSLSSMLIKNTDTWMIGRMISTVGVALYNPALRISNLVEVPTLAVASLVFPQVNRKMHHSGKAGIQDIYVKSVSVILAMMLPGIIPLYVFSDLVVELIFGKAYLEAAPILRVTIFFTLIIPFNRQFGTVMDALKRPKINFYLLVMTGVLNIIFNYFFIKRYGPIGAAYGTLISYLIIFVLNQIILFRLYGINTFKVFTGIFQWYKAGWNFFRTKLISSPS